jgi:hypothetical protein
MHMSGERQNGEAGLLSYASQHNTLSSKQEPRFQDFTAPKLRVESVMSTHRLWCCAQDDELIRFICVFPKMNKTREGGKDWQVRDKLKGYAIIFTAQQTIRRGESVHL